MSYPIGEIKHAYLGTSVYSSLREALVTGRLKPDDKLRIRDLASQLGTSVTPVRDAILQLAKEQALVMKTPKDIRVPTLTRQQYLEIRSVRLALEGLAAESAAALATEEDFQRIEANITANLEAIHREDMSEALKLNQTFHFFLPTSPRCRCSVVFWTACGCAPGHCWRWPMIISRNAWRSNTTGRS